MPAESSVEADQAHDRTRHRVVVSSEANESEWDCYVNQHPDSTGYHAWPWRVVFERAFRHQTEYLIARAGSGVVGVLPLVIVRSRLFGTAVVSLPFVNYGGILADDEATARALLERAAQIAKRYNASHVELRHTRQQFEELPARRHKVSLMLRLARDTETAWNLLDRKVRNQVRKAQKHDLTTVCGRTELLEDFYAVFAQNMRDLGTPVYGRQLFEQVLEQFPEHARIFVVRSEGKSVAAGLSYRHRGTLELPWASSLFEHRSLCGNVLLYWTVIEHAIATGAVKFDFGRSTLGDSAFHFKKQWRTDPYPHCWEYYLLSKAEPPNLSPSNAKFRLAIELWKRLPVGLATLIGPRIVRGIP